MTNEMIAILDFGSQYVQLIARRVREHNVFSRICRSDITAQELGELPLKGIILSGGPASVYGQGAPKCDPAIFDLGVPILGICYGMHLGCQILGCEIAPAQHREFGHADLSIQDMGNLFKNMPESTVVWMSHGDRVVRLAEGFQRLIELVGDTHRGGQAGINRTGAGSTDPATDVASVSI